MDSTQRDRGAASSGEKVGSAAAPRTRGGLSYEKVARRAYEIWQESGCPHGLHEEHWYRAERELLARR